MTLPPENGSDEGAGLAGTGANADAESAPFPEQASAPAAEVARPPLSIALALCLGALATCTLLVLFAEPIRDGDLWWHLAYARQMITNRTLIPDHTLYSWTPAAGGRIYCAWLAELALYGAYTVGRLPLLFVLRYAFLFAVFAILVVHARTEGVVRHPLCWLICVLAGFMSYSAGFIKPEIVSYLCMAVMALAWIRMKGRNPHSHYWCYVFPLVTLVWVNSHGGVIFGMMFLGVVAVGEEMNALYSPHCALPVRVRRHLFFALLLTGLALVATPYGVPYPLQLFKALVTKDPYEMRTIQAYASVFSPGKARLHYDEYFVLAVGLLAVLLARPLRERKLDWALVLVNLVFGALYTAFLRTTFYWAPVFGISALSLLARGPIGLRFGPVWRQRALAGVVAGVMLFLGGRTLFESACRPVKDRWLGFGISYFNPVEEAEYLREHCAGKRLGHDYNSGGYYLWRLWPEIKIFIDPRQFPYRQWLREYRDFVTGRDRAPLLQRFPADIWSIQYSYKSTLSWFLNDPNWQPVFYGPVAVIFARRSGPGQVVPGRAPGVGDIRNWSQAMQVLAFALNVGDLQGADIVFAGIQRRFGGVLHRDRVADAALLLDGLRAYYAGDYERSAALLTAARDKKLIRSTVLLARCYQQQAAASWRAGDDLEAHRLAVAAMAVDPQGLVSLYNVGVIEWYLAQQGIPVPERPPAPSQSRRLTWRHCLALFAEKARGTEAAPARLVILAEDILAGAAVRRPPLLVPSVSRAMTE